MLSGIVSNVTEQEKYFGYDFEGMPKYGVTPLLSPFDIDFDRPLLAASSLLLVTRTPGLPQARQQCLISLFGHCLVWAGAN